MSDIPFYRTIMGQRFYEGTMPALVRAIEANTEALQSAPGRQRRFESVPAGTCYTMAKAFARQVAPIVGAEGILPFFTNDNTDRLLRTAAGLLSRLSESVTEASEFGVEARWHFDEEGRTIYELTVPQVSVCSHDDLEV